MKIRLTTDEEKALHTLIRNQLDCGATTVAVTLRVSREVAEGLLKEDLTTYPTEITIPFCEL